MGIGEVPVKDEDKDKNDTDKTEGTDKTDTDNTTGDKDKE